MVQLKDGTWAENHGCSGLPIQHKKGENPENLHWIRGLDHYFYNSEIMYFAITN